MISVATLIAWLDAEQSDAVMLAELEEQAVAQIERATGRYFGPLGPVTEVVPGTDVRRLYLTDLPTAAEGADVVVDAEYGEAGGTLAVDADFVLRRVGVEAWLERTDGGVWDADYEYHVVYQRGYAEGAEPPDIRAAVTELVSERWNARGKQGLHSETYGGYSFTAARGTDRSTVADVIERWKRPVFA